MSAVLPKDETDSLRNRQVVYSYSVASRVASGIQQLLYQPNWSIFPNPASEYINISMSQLSYSKLSIRIYTMEGKLVKQINRNSALDERPLISIKLTGDGGVKLSSGIYIAELVIDGKLLSHKKLAIK